ncbi:MAG: hypothetical protein GY835_22600 [bacterium]|nr:hypothetical protein [bacterium]
MRILNNSKPAQERTTGNSSNTMINFYFIAPVGAHLHCTALQHYPFRMFTAPQLRNPDLLKLVQDRDGGWIMLDTGVYENEEVSWPEYAATIRSIEPDYAVLPDVPFGTNSLEYSLGFERYFMATVPAGARTPKWILTPQGWGRPAAIAAILGALKVISEAPARRYMLGLGIIRQSWEWGDEWELYHLVNTLRNQLFAYDHRAAPKVHILGSRSGISAGPHHSAYPWLLSTDTCKPWRVLERQLLCHHGAPNVQRFALTAAHNNPFYHGRDWPLSTFYKAAHPLVKSYGYQNDKQEEAHNALAGLGSVQADQPPTEDDGHRCGSDGAGG